MEMTKDIHLPNDRMHVYWTQGRFLVWDPEAILKIRRDYRIVGTLTGTLTLIPNQNIYLSVPLQLLPQEVACLLDLECIYVIDTTTKTSPYRDQPTPSPELLQSYTERVNKELLEFFEYNQEQKRIASEQFMPKVAEKEIVDSSIEDNLKNAKSLFAYLPDNVLYNTSESITPAMMENEYLASKLPTKDSVQNAPLLQLLQEIADSATFKAFNALYHQHPLHYQTSGTKFSGETLLYTGDPCFFHSSHIVVAFDARDAVRDRICWRDVLGVGRVAVFSKKKICVAFIQEDKKDDKKNSDVKLYELEWTGW